MLSLAPVGRAYVRWYCAAHVVSSVVTVVGRNHVRQPSSFDFCVADTYESSISSHDVNRPLTVPNPRSGGQWTGGVLGGAGGVLGQLASGVHQPCEGRCGHCSASVHDELCPSAAATWASTCFHVASATAVSWL